jgi:hypothetical protein
MKKIFNDIYDALNYLSGIEDGGIEVGEYEQIVIEFKKFEVEQ